MINNLKTRYLEPNILEDLKEKMVFIGGPRQVGKTTLAQYIGDSFYPHYSYYNWDSFKDQKKVIQMNFPEESKLLVFDEIHKYKKWKNFIKGIFDREKELFHILVTGSARLDIYYRGGDSMMGRYHYYRLHPFSLYELLYGPRKKIIEPFGELEFSSHGESSDTLKTLIQFGGFPEPLFRQDEKMWRRWQDERMQRLVREDIRDIELVRDLSALEILIKILPDKVGSLLSLNALREDLEVAHPTITHWMDIFERFYYHFRIFPFAATPIKSLRKEPKMYLWDWSVIKSEGARFENLIASHLLKFTHFLHDTLGYRTELHFLRDREGREVDFLVTSDQKPWFAVEVKQNSKEDSKHLRYFGDRLKIPFLYQVVKEPNIHLVSLKNDIQIISAEKFLTGLV